MSIRCIVLINHKNRIITQRAIHSRSPYFVKMRATNWQVAAGAHHEYAINLVKIKLTNDGLDPKDFDFVSFDWFEGLFLDSLFSGKGKNDVLLFWDKIPVFDIRELGPAPPFEDGYFLPEMMEECTECGTTNQHEKILFTEKTGLIKASGFNDIISPIYKKEVDVYHKLPKPSIN